MNLFTQGSLFLSFTFFLAATSSIAQIHDHGTGTLFEFDPSLGACGYTNTSEEIVASVSSVVFKGYPGATANPNKNPICQHKLFIRDQSGSKNVTASIVDYFVSKNDDNVGLSRAGFIRFADETDGIVPNVTWVIV